MDREEDAQDGGVSALGDQGVRDQATRGVALLSIRQILVGLVTVAGIVALPLLLGPADFSLYGYVNMIVLLGAAVGDLGLGAYLIKHEVSDRKLRGMLGLQLLFWVGLGLLLMGIAVLLDPFGFSALTYGLLCGGLVLFALQSLPTALMEKRLAFRRISLLEVIQRVLLVAVAIGFAVFEPSEWAIPLAALLAAAAIYPAFMWLARWPGPPMLVRGEPLFRGFASEWWQTRIANQSSYAAFPILGGLLLTATDVGLLIWALSISLIPGYLAPMAARALYPVLARASVEERAELHELILRALLFLGAPLVVFLFIVAPAATDAIFGEPWDSAVPSLRILLLTSVVGISLSIALPHIFLSSRPTSVKWLSVASTTLIFLLGFLLNPFLAIEAIPVATLISGILLWFGFEFLLRTSDGFSSIRTVIPAYTGLITAIAISLPISRQIADTSLLVLVLAVGGVLIQVLITTLLGGAVSLRGVRQQLASLRS